ncbi:MAG: type II toxin-antitoxin system RatA family toxin [Actinomycetes bacterium]
MRSVNVSVVAPNRDPADAYAVLVDYAAYPRFSPAVRGVDVWTGPDGAVFSRWVVEFRSGLLRWTERDLFDPEHHVIEFAQVEGDVAAFAGSWRCEPVDDGTRVTFAATVDLGIPSLAEVLDPIAARTLVDNTVAILEGLLGPGLLVEDAVPHAVGRPA